MANATSISYCFLIFIIPGPYPAPIFCVITIPFQKHEDMFLFLDLNRSSNQVLNLKVVNLQFIPCGVLP